MAGIGARLVMKVANRDRTFPIDRDSTIGSDPGCDVVVEGSGVLPRAARIYFDEAKGAYWVESLGDPGSVEVDNFALRAPQRLGAISVITVGGIDLVFQFVERPSEPVVSVPEEPRPAPRPPDGESRREAPPTPVPAPEPPSAAPPAAPTPPPSAPTPAPSRGDRTEIDPFVPTPPSAEPTPAPPRRDRTEIQPFLPTPLFADPTPVPRAGERTEVHPFVTMSPPSDPALGPAGGDRTEIRPFEPMPPPSDPAAGPPRGERTEIQSFEPVTPPPDPAPGRADPQGRTLTEPLAPTPAIPFEPAPSNVRLERPTRHESLRLRIESPPELAGAHELRDGNTMLGGTSECGIAITHWSVSRRHALLTVREGACRLRDLGSTNGTYVEGRRIEAEVDLLPGAAVTFGKIVAVLEAMPRVH
jgi:hypothetical protein